MSAPQLPHSQDSLRLIRRSLSPRVSSIDNFNSFNLHWPKLALECLLSLPFGFRFVVFKLPCRDMFEKQLVNFLKRAPSSL
jgi:hypothetical protein